MGTNMYPSSSLLGNDKDQSIATLPVDELIEKADGFSGVFPGKYAAYKMWPRESFCTTIFDPCFHAEHKYKIVMRLQSRKHIVGMTGNGVTDAPAIKKADIGIAAADSTDAARGACDIVLTEPGLSVIISAVLTSRSIFQRMKNVMVKRDFLFILRGKFP